MSKTGDDKTPEFVCITVFDEPRFPSYKTTLSLGITTELPSCGIGIEDDMSSQRLQDKGCTKEHLPNYHLQNRE